MKSSAKWLIAALILILIGAGVFYYCMDRTGWNFEALDTEKYTTETYTVEDRFTDISVTASTADVRFEPSGDETCRVVCELPESAALSVTVQNRTLTVETEPAHGWLSSIRFSSRSPKITVYLPGSAYGRLTVQTKTGDTAIPRSFAFESVELASHTGSFTCYAAVSGAVRITTSTGDARLESMRAGSLTMDTNTGDMTVRAAEVDGDITIRVSTGEVLMTDVTCRSLFTDGSTGDARLSHVAAKERMQIERTTGDIRLEQCDAETLLLKASSGDIRGSLLTGKTFVTNTGTGDVHVPATAGGTCEITTGTGDISITVG